MYSVVRSNSVEANLETGRRVAHIIKLSHYSIEQRPRDESSQITPDLKVVGLSWPARFLPITLRAK